MVRLFILLAGAALVLVVLALISALSAERVRHAPRAVWVLVVLFVPIAGPIAYLLVGRPIDRTRRPSRRPAAPDDDPDFLRSVGDEQSRRDRELLAQWEREIPRDDEQQDRP
jgi:hypothetical protein